MKNGLPCLLMAALLALSACTVESLTLTPTSEARIFSAADQPKVLVTLAGTPTPLPSPTLDLAPTLTPIAVRPAPTLPFITPTVSDGVFVGDGVLPPVPTSASGLIIAPPTPLGTLVGRAVDCPIAVASAFRNAYDANPSLRGVGCPIESGTVTALAVQRFERGWMFWRDTRQVLILADNGTYWRATDTWDENQPPDDPALVPPEGLRQPIRGFGLLWRNNSVYREALGWAQGPEFTLASYWQEFERGTLLLGNNSLVYGLANASTGRYAGGFSQ